MNIYKQEPGNRFFPSQHYGSMLSPKSARRSINNPATPVITENELESGAESSTVNNSRGFFSSTDGIYTHSELEGSACSDEEHLTTGNILIDFFV